MALDDQIDLKNAAVFEAGVPWQAFAELRSKAPVYWNPETDGAGFWALTRHADIVAVSRNPRLFSSAYENGGHRIFNENEIGLTGAGDSAIGIPLISRDPPVHTQYRKHIMPSVSPARLGDIEARIRLRVEALVDAIPLGEPVDLVPLLSAPLPLLTLCELLGVEQDLWTRLYDWTNAFVGEDDPEFRQSPEAMAATLQDFFAFAGDLFDTRRAQPGSDIASMLANMEIGGDAATLPEFIGNLILVLVGANETTRNSLSHTVAAFSANPGQWQALRADRTLFKTAVPEMVRWASPVLHMRRTAMEDTELAGQAIRKGDKVVMWYASGNRDEAVFTAADAFDITRAHNPHVGFGFGQHVCVGSRLAEMQLRIAFDTLADRVSRFEVTGEPRRFRSSFLNGLKNLDVVLHPC